MVIHSVAVSCLPEFPTIKTLQLVVRTGVRSSCEISGLPYCMFMQKPVQSAAFYLNAFPLETQEDRDDEIAKTIFADRIVGGIVCCRAPNSFCQTHLERTSKLPWTAGRPG